jgi:uncharacterized protein
MKKIELEIVALSPSITQNNSYALVLGEIGGARRMPILVGAFEAQAIAVALERMHTSRPLTHDLFYNFFNSFNIELVEVIIYKLEDGIFFAKLICMRDGAELVEIDSRTSDALALAIRANCPTYTHENIIESAGIYLNSEERPAKREIQAKASSTNPKTNSNNNSDLKNMSFEELNDLLQQVLDQEDYVRAINIRDEINNRNNPNK